MSYDRRTLLKYMAGTSAAGLLAGCGEDVTTETLDADPVNVIEGIECPEGCDCANLEPDVSGGSFSLWHSRDQAAADLLAVTKNFWNQDADAEMAVSEIPNNYQDKLRNDLAAAQGPDLFLWAHDMIGELQANGVLNDISGDTRVEECMFTDKSWEAVHYNDGMYGLPYAAECPALLYNKDILGELDEEPPETLDEWKSIMDQWMDEGNNYALGHPIDPYMSTWAAHAYGSIVYDGEELGLANQEFADGLNIIFKQLKQYMPNDPARAAQSAVFNDGVAPFLVDGPWTIPEYQDNDDFDVGVVPIPDPADGTARPYTGMQIVYTTAMPEDGSQNETAARQFAEWYTTNDERLSNLARKAGYIPIKSSFTGASGLPELVKGFSKQVEDGVLMPKNPDLQAVWGPFEDAVTTGFNNDGITVDRLETAAEQIRDEWNS